jgi:hypothetical protein
MARDDFSLAVKNLLARRVSMRCSNPNCQIPTGGPQIDPNKAVNVGVAAHITAASPGGPRYDASLTPAQRQSPANGIWLCQTHGKLVDNDGLRYPAELLREWKRVAESAALSAIEGVDGGQGSTVRPSWPEKHGEYVAASSEAIPLFPPTLGGYRFENDKDFWGRAFPSKGSIRVFQGEDWQGLHNFPNTMNGCSAGVFMIRWRLSDPEVRVQSSVRYSSKVGDTTKTGAFGCMSGTNCDQPMFKFAGTINGNQSTLVDVYYELKFWQTAP